MSRPRLAPALVGSLVLLLAGCVGAQQVAVSMTDFTYQPQPIEILADTPLTTELTNDGSVPHDFTIEALLDTDTPVHLAVFPDGMAPLSIPPLPKGSYVVYCGVVGHRDQGMETVLIVS